MAATRATKSGLAAESQMKVRREKAFSDHFSIYKNINLHSQSFLIAIHIPFKKCQVVKRLKMHKIVFLFYALPCLLHGSLTFFLYSNLINFDEMGISPLVKKIKIQTLSLCFSGHKLLHFNKVLA